MKTVNFGNGNNTAIEQMNFFKKQLLRHSICCIFVDIRNNAFLLSGSTVRTGFYLSWVKPKTLKLVSAVTLAKRSAIKRSAEIKIRQ